MTDSTAVGRAIGRITSGIYVVTAGEGENERLGMLASWVMQAGFNPPAVTIGMQRDREILKTIGERQKLVINVLSDSNSNLMGRFAKFRPDPFGGLDIRENGHGVILLDAVAFLSCELRAQWEGGDHIILYGEVIDGEILNPDLQPWCHLRKNGFVY